MADGKPTIIRDFPGRAVDQHLKQFHRLPSEKCSDLRGDRQAKAEAACTQPVSWDDGVPYCDSCGLFRSTVAAEAAERTRR